MSTRLSVGPPSNDRPSKAGTADGRRTESVGEYALITQEPINILIVDDEPGNLMVLETVLEDPGYRLVRAQSADQALLALVEEEFALLILDIRMPGMTGFELAKMVKGRRKTADIPIIFLTAYYDSDQHALEGYGRGAVDYLNKPVNPTVLRSKVAVFADLHRKNRAITLANRALVAEVQERRRAEEQLRELNETLERRVTERTEALRQADDRLQAMMSSITDGLLMLDRNWCFTYANEQGARLLGMRPEQLLGAYAWGAFPHAQGTQFAEGCRRAVQTRQTVSFEEFYPEPLNQWFQCHCYPSDDGLSVYFHNITDRRENEARREQLLRAEQASRSEGERVARAKDEFLAFLSHELRTPLAAIVGWASMLRRPDTDAETLRRGVDAIARNAKAQSHLVADLLDMSRIVSGKLRMNVESVNLNQIALAATESARPAAQGKGLRIDLRLAAEGSLDLMGDAARLQQVVSNLVTNAVKFTPSGGVVTVSTRSTDCAVELLVADTGEGIAAQFLPHIFDRFSQADDSVARVHGGLGLGLSIVKNLVEMHAGTVTASSPGRGLGSTFRVEIPTASGTQASAASLPLRQAGESGGPVSLSGVALTDDEFDLRGVAVLLVDDHDDVLEVERRLLADCGAVVTTAISAEQAQLLLRTRRFDVLLSDLGMPGQDGYGLINDVRTTLGLSAQDLPAAAVTAFVRAEDRQRALQSGYQACIQKPVSPTTLARTVLQLLQARVAVAAPAGQADADGTAGRPQPAQLDGLGGADPQAAALSRVRLRALAVEDNPDLRFHLEWMLDEEGVDAVICGSGEEAESEFAKGGFDLVVTDVRLPKMSGEEFARRVLARSPDTWLVFSTGYPLDDQSLALGPNVRALPKPIDTNRLRQLMAEVRSGLARGGAAF